LYFASFAALLACVYSPSAREASLHFARTFAREASQRFGRYARLAHSAQAHHRSVLLQRFGFSAIVLLNVFACRAA
jgi:hypothetical protein